MRSALLWLFVCLALPCLRADETPATPSTPSPFEQAAAEAARENKNILLVFTGKWEPACTELEDDCLRTEKVKNLLTTQTIVARIDVLNQPELTAKYHVRNVPLMILLRPDGREVDRWLSAVSASRFAEEFSLSLGGHPTIERLRSEVKPAKPETRRDLANTLFARGSYADALTELKRLYEQLEYGTTKQQLRANRRERNRVITLLGEIHRAYPPAAEFLRTKRSAHATDAAPPANQTKYTARVASIDVALDQPDETLAYFRSLPAGCGARNEIRSQAFLLLIKNKEYAEAAALYKPEELVNQIEQYAKIPWSIVHTIIRARFPIKGGDFIKLFHSGFTYRFTQSFEVYAALQNKEAARQIATAIIKRDRSEQAVPFLAKAAHRALGDNADAFLRSLEIPGLPSPGKISAADAPEPIDTSTNDDDEDAAPVVKLSPFVVSTRTFGAVPLDLFMPIVQTQKKIQGHPKIKTPADVGLETLVPYRAGGWLVAINGKSVKEQEWKWLTDFWFQGGETGTPVTLILRGTGFDDCIYREITVKRVRPPVPTSE